MFECDFADTCSWGPSTHCGHYKICYIYFSPTLFFWFKATIYIDLIDWEVEQKTEPPLTMSLSHAGIISALKKPLTLASYPNHTQTVERTVPVVTESFLQKVGFSGRHMYLSNILSQKYLIHFFQVDPLWKKTWKSAKAGSIFQLIYALQVFSVLFG